MQIALWVSALLFTQKPYTTMSRLVRQAVYSASRMRDRQRVVILLHLMPFIADCKIFRRASPSHI
jgi:hypothetical protein